MKSQMTATIAIPVANLRHGYFSPCRRGCQGHPLAAAPCCVKGKASAVVAASSQALRAG